MQDMDSTTVRTCSLRYAAAFILLPAGIQLAADCNQRAQDAYQSSIVFEQNPIAEGAPMPAPDASSEAIGADRVHVPGCDTDAPRVVRYAAVGIPAPSSTESISLAATTIRAMQNGTGLQVRSSNQLHLDQSSDTWLMRAFATNFPYNRGGLREPRLVRLALQVRVQVFSSGVN